MSEDADWEVVQDGAHVGGDDDVRSAGGLGHVVRSAGQWAQWSYHGASIGVEKAVDGVKGMWHFKRLRAERQEALSLASRQQWQLMDIEHQRRRERQAAVEAEEKRARELRDQEETVRRAREEAESAQTRWRAREDELQVARGEREQQAAEVDALRRDAEARRFQAAAALAALEELREKQAQQEEEARAAAQALGEREAELQAQCAAHVQQVKTLEAALAEVRAAGAADARAAGGGAGAELPDEFYCPITLSVMSDPVLAADGFSYERVAIQDWLSKGHRTSPKTGARLESDQLLPNLSLRALIQQGGL